MASKLSFVYIIGLCLICIDNLNAQISEGGFPPSFKYKNVFKSSAETSIQIPIDFNIEDLKIQDAWQVEQGAPLKVAILIETQLGIDNSGSWTTLPDGEKVWRLNIQAKGATALMLYYKEFYIPEGGKLFIYNSDQSQVIGAYTSITNPNSGKFATEFVAGDDIILEYVAPESGEEPHIQIEDIGYGYNHLKITNDPSFESTSGPCQVNVNCEEGLAWQDEKNGVCRIVTRIGKNAHFCSGSLINNTAQDFKPYILSADHCTQDKYTLQRSTKENFNQWVFYFGYEKRDCSNASLGKPANTMVGCQKIAFSPVNGGSDGLLLLLNDLIPTHYNSYYNGWDRSNTPARSGAAIHHPMGDYMKISTFTEPAIHMSWEDRIGNIGIEKSHWNIAFVQTKNGYSVTEGGSSGSPFFNQNNLIVGTLTGGSTLCEKVNGLNLYGKLHSHWNYFSADTSRMDIWLDPLNTGTMTLNGSYNIEQEASPIELSLNYVNLNVELMWDAPMGDEKPVMYKIFRNNVLLDKTTKTSYIDYLPELGSQTYSISSVYPNGIESSTIYKTIFISEYLPPIHVKANYLSNNDVVLTWDPAEYLQTIFWGDGIAAVSNISYKGTPFYFAQTWSKTDIAPIYKNKIKAVNFFPIEFSEYSIVIIQGDRKYTQKVLNPVYQELNSIELETPFIINNDNSLLVAIYVSKYDKNVYPAACDNGPAINGKGNLFSFDGIKWNSYFNDIAKDDSYNKNFIIQPIISDDGGASTKIMTTYSPVNQLKNTTDEGRIPSSFFERTGYNIYRNNEKINTTLVTGLKYTDKNVPPGLYSYSVEAVYGNKSSMKSAETIDIQVSNISVYKDDISIVPTLFADQISILNPHLVKQIEIISIGGKLVDKITHISETINTGHLQSGIYLFRLFTEKEVKIIKAIKK